MSRPLRAASDLGDLSPSEGLSSLSVGVDGLDNLGHGSAAIRFKLFTKEDGVERVMTTLAFQVEPGDDGMEGMVARGYDALIDALRQMLLQAAMSRKQYKKRAEIYASAKAKLRG